MVSTILASVVSTLLALDCVSLVIIAWRGRAFLRSTSRIESEEDFTAYRDLVIGCMKLTFGFVMLFTASIILCCGGMMLGWIRVVDIEAVLLMGLMRLMGTCLMSVNVEARLKNIPTSGPPWHLLKREVVRLWDAEPWPRRIYHVGMAVPAVTVELK